MKSILQQSTPKPFTPQTLTLTFESQNEIDTFYTLFNFTTVSNCFDRHDTFASNIRNSLRPVVSEEQSVIFSNLVKHFGSCFGS